MKVRDAEQLVFFFFWRNLFRIDTAVNCSSSGGGGQRCRRVNLEFGISRQLLSRSEEGNERRSKRIYLGFNLNEKSRLTFWIDERFACFT